MTSGSHGEDLGYWWDVGVVTWDERDRSGGSRAAGQREGSLSEGFQRAFKVPGASHVI